MSKISKIAFLRKNVSGLFFLLMFSMPIGELPCIAADWKSNDWNPDNSMEDLGLSDRAGGCEAPKQGPKGPTGATGATGATGPSGISGIASYASVYTTTEDIIHSNGGILEFEKNPAQGGPVGHANIVFGGLTALSQDTGRPTRITSFLVTVAGDYLVSFHATVANSGVKTLAVVKGGTVTPGSGNTSGQAVGFTVFNQSVESTQTREIIGSSIIHLIVGDIIKVVNVGPDLSQINLNSNLPTAVTGSLVIELLRAGT